MEWSEPTPPSSQMPSFGKKQSSLQMQPGGVMGGGRWGGIGGGGESGGREGGDGGGGVRGGALGAAAAGGSSHSARPRGLCNRCSRCRVGNRCSRCLRRRRRKSLVCTAPYRRCRGSPERAAALVARGTPCTRRSRAMQKSSPTRSSCRRSPRERRARRLRAGRRRATLPTQGCP